jgi:hypothetical protein
LTYYFEVVIIKVSYLFNRALRQELEKVRFELESQGDQLPASRLAEARPVKATFYKSVVGVR